MGSLNYYKISKSDADLIGIFDYGNGEIFRPDCGEQVDGTYLVDVKLIETLADNENIKKVDWEKLEIINESKINDKIITI